MAGNSHDRLCKRVSNVKLMPCHLASIILIVLYCCLWCKNAEAFVQLSLQRSALAATGCRATPAADAASATATSAALTVGIDYSRSSNWRTATSIRRKRRIRTAGRRAGSSGGVRSLKAAGLGFPPLPGSEMIDYVGRELAEQSVKHHWSSGFIGGSVGVMGTLTAIQASPHGVMRVISALALLIASNSVIGRLWTLSKLTDHVLAGPSPMLS